MKKRVLVTGAAGFIGHHVVSYLLEHTDFDIVSLDRYDDSGNPNKLLAIDNFDTQRVKVVFWDLKSPINEHVSKQLGQFDHIIHLAASSHVDRSLTDPMLFIMDNVVGTTNLLLWAKGNTPRFDGQGGLLKGGKFINFSTDEVFGPADDGYAHNENDPHKPSNPYSASKSGQEAIGYAFWVSYGLPVITTHTMNNFGERQHTEKLIPKTIRSIVNQEPMPIFAKVGANGELEAVGSRYWMHCINTASAILFLLDKGVPGEAYNIIAFDELTNLQIAEEIALLIGKPFIPKFVDFYTVRPGHDRRYALDGTKIQRLGWKPELSFEESLKRTVSFSLANTEWL